jgi:vacuolar-type H+-ATPase subunit E/Vma4
MHVVGSVDAVMATIRAEADAEVERLRTRADEEIARLRNLPPETDAGDRESRLIAARKHNDELAAQMDWEERRRVIEQRETWIERVIARADELLRSATVDQRKESLAGLAREALQRVRGEQIELRVAAHDRSLVDDAWCREIAPGSSVGENAPIRGGCLVRSGALVFDNTFEERAKRLEPVWRKALAGMYRV